MKVQQLNDIFSPNDLTLSWHGPSGASACSPLSNDGFFLEIKNTPIKHFIILKRPRPVPPRLMLDCPALLRRGPGAPWNWPRPGPRIPNPDLWTEASTPFCFQFFSNSEVGQKKAGRARPQIYVSYAPSVPYLCTKFLPSWHVCVFGAVKSAC